MMPEHNILNYSKNNQRIDGFPEICKTNIYESQG